MQTQQIRRRRRRLAAAAYLEYCRSNPERPSDESLRQEAIVARARRRKSWIARRFASQLAGRAAAPVR